MSYNHSLFLSYNHSLFQLSGITVVSGSRKV